MTRFCVLHSSSNLWLTSNVFLLTGAIQLAHLSEMEVKHRCKQALEMGFDVFGLAKLFAQDWEGDVTIVMPATFAQVKFT